LWKDVGQDGADAVLIAYGELDRVENGGNGRRHRGLVTRHLALLDQLGGRVLHVVPTGPLVHNGRPTLDREHFGFRDGISQPVIRGSQRESQADAQDLARAGEFILGYLNNQEMYAPPIWVTAESDYRNDLPTLDANLATRFPLFGAPTATRDARDFGRNGSFLAVRQLDQDVDGFRRSTELHAAAIRSRYRDIEAVAGHPIDADWVAAKMVGRWSDGTPLIGHPAHPAQQRDNRLANNFAYGSDDPRGFSCPMGAHIRRANPRDSFEPGDASERLITSRHRLLRRGRSYCYSPVPDQEEKRGLLFMALCSDLERQFEFVQHSWVNSGSFHALTNERDPIASDSSAEPGCFTIPMPAGPIVLSNVASHVHLRAGGYFFVPSLSACKYLCSVTALSKPGEPEEWTLRRDLPPLGAAEELVATAEM
jgi:Dyp-type peroxidase family